MLDVSCLMLISDPQSGSRAACVLTVTSPAFDISLADWTSLLIVYPSTLSRPRTGVGQSAVFRSVFCARLILLIGALISRASVSWKETHQCNFSRPVVPGRRVEEIFYESAPKENLPMKLVRNILAGLFLATLLMTTSGETFAQGPVIISADENGRGTIE